MQQPPTSHGYDGHVAVMAFPFGTHAAPMLAVTRRLATYCPTTIFSFFNTSESNISVFSTADEHKLVAPNVKAYELADGVPEGYAFTGKPQERIELFMKAAPRSFREAMEAAVSDAGGKAVSCLVTDAFFWFAAEMAEEMGVAWLPFWTAGVCSLSAHFYTDYIRDRLGSVRDDAVGHEEEPISCIPGMSKIKVGDLPEGVVFGDTQSFFSCMLQKMGLALPKAAAVLINTFQELDPTITSDLNSKFKKFLTIGPVHSMSPSPAAADTYTCIPWLHKQKLASVAYVGFGSVTTPPPHELVALAEALEASNVPFIWSIRDSAKGNLPGGFLERTHGSQGILVPWAPQTSVLAHVAVGVFITHGGWNSLVESVAGGVPMICRPFFGDQRLNGRMVQDVWQVGLKLGPGAFTKDGIIESLDQILYQEKGKILRHNVRALKQLSDIAIGPNGSSTINFMALSEFVSPNP
ncbi:hypothetical protein Tsubulata_020002 [Turnera subulata]|uniref:Glycosyltransferase n=1 Tax=Turnera subulata TaxID=218843 RepID=A0A9Q0JAT2_9ROSI|nr:hypothetical protein Tsubulata_020002 [Turnera subulata]